MTQRTVNRIAARPDLGRDICLALVLKLVLLASLYGAFFSPGHRYPADTAAHLFDLSPAKAISADPFGGR